MENRSQPNKYFNKEIFNIKKVFVGKSNLFSLYFGTENGEQQLKKNLYNEAFNKWSIKLTCIEASLLSRIMKVAATRSRLYFFMKFFVDLEK